MFRDYDHLIQDHAEPLNPVRKRTSGGVDILGTVVHLSSLMCSSSDHRVTLPEQVSSFP